MEVTIDQIIKYTQIGRRTGQIHVVLNDRRNT